MSLLVASSLTVTVAGCDHKKDDTTTKVHDALKKLDQKHPLEIPYNQKNPKAPASDPAVAKVIRDQLKSKNPTIFTSTVVAEITFSKTPLKENTAVQVQATYKEKATPIYVKENDQSEAQKVINILKTFNSPDNAVVIDAKYAGKYADEYSSGVLAKAGDAIRGYILKSSKITFRECVIINFSHTLLKKDTSVTVTATYKGKSTDILVKLKKISKIEEKVKNVLQRFSSQSNRLKISTRDRALKASDIKGSNLIRDALVKQGRGGLTRPLANQITFGDDIIGVGSATLPIRVEWNTTATFRQVEVIIYGVSNPRLT